MFDIGASELLMIVIVAVVVIGPKDLPRALRTAGKWIGKVRRTSNHFRAGIETMIREAEMEEMEKKWAEQNARIMAEHVQAGLDRDRIRLDEQAFAGFLYTAGQPDPDLLIRTSGEMRVSNFLLWQIAYSEIWVTETLWPDFRRRDLLEAVVAYQKRDRRYGGIKPSPVALGAK